MDEPGKSLIQTPQPPRSFGRAVRTEARTCEIVSLSKSDHPAAATEFGFKIDESQVEDFDLAVDHPHGLVFGDVPFLITHIEKHKAMYEWNHRNHSASNVKVRPGDRVTQVDCEPVDPDDHERGMELLNAKKKITLRIRPSTQGVSMVIVFPSECQEGGSRKGLLDSETTVEDPQSKAESIFLRGCNPDQTKAEFAANERTAALSEVDIDAVSYHNIVREHFQKLLIGKGFILDTKLSVDGDEVFLKLTMPLEFLKKLATHYHYCMPLSDEAYAGADLPGADTEDNQNRCMRNVFGQDARAYMWYDADLWLDIDPSVGRARRERPFQAFRSVDILRLMPMWLDEWVSLQQLEQQQVIRGYFVMCEEDRLKALRDSWVYTDWGNQLIPSSEDLLEIRNYFGERIAFFFAWYHYYIYMLYAIAGVGGSLWVLGLISALNDQRLILDYAYILLAVLIVGGFMQRFNQRSNTLQQEWGMKDWSHTSSRPREEYDEELEGSWQLWFRMSAADGIAFLYMTVYTWVVCVMSLRQMNNQKNGTGSGNAIESYANVILIFLFKFVWSQIAPVIAAWHNPKTTAQYEDKMASYLVFVKVFVVLVPFLGSAFLKDIMLPRAFGDTLQEAADKVYAKRGLPDLVDYGSLSEFWMSSGQTTSGLDWLKPFAYHESDGTVSISGCFPEVCAKIPAAALSVSSLFPWIEQSGTLSSGYKCITRCETELAGQYLMYWITHIISQVLFLIIPDVIIRWNLRSEVRKRIAEKKAAANELDRHTSRLSTNDNFERFGYPAEQLHAKLHKYDYGEWGGSYVEDFMELAIGFALLACFGVVVPEVSIVVLISSILEYRLMAYRMTTLTRRPYPLGAEGIGVWKDIFRNLGVLATIINVAYVVYAMYPLKHLPGKDQFLAFLAVEHVVVIARYFVISRIPDFTAEHGLIEDFNNYQGAMAVKHVNVGKLVGIQQKKAGIGDLRVLEIEENDEEAGLLDNCKC